MIKSLLTSFIILIASLNTAAQNRDSLHSKALAAVVTLDSVVIMATKAGFEVEDFIGLIVSDTSLHTAFTNLRTTSSTFRTAMTFQSKTRTQLASLDGRYQQVIEGKCRELSKREEVVEGNYYKGRKKKLRYYTAKMYQQVFVTQGRVCTDDGSGQPRDESRMDHHISELKRLVFSPGSKADVPLIGKKTEMFSEDMIVYYDFYIHSVEFSGTPAYLFEARVKPEFQKNVNKTVIKELKTWFSKEDFQVLSRTYRLSHDTALYMFDVSMHVDLQKQADKYLPIFIRYEGIWNVPFQKRESGIFEIHFDHHFQTN